MVHQLGSNACSDLKKLGFNKELTEGISTALENYQNVDLKKYVALIQESLQYLKPGKETLPDTKIEKTVEEKPKKTKKKVEKTEETKKEDESQDADFEKIDNTVLETIKGIEGQDGAPWDSITEKCEKAGIDKDSIEEALTSLMDKGLVYEPILGTIKST